MDYFSQLSGNDDHLYRVSDYPREAYPPVVKIKNMGTEEMMGPDDLQKRLTGFSLNL